jgi:ABC-2 type transport system permease protein
MSRAMLKQTGKIAGFIAVPLALVVAMGLIAVRRFEWYLVVGLIALLVLLALFAATNPDVWQRALGRRRISSVLSGIIVMIALVGIIALVNILTARTNVQLDLTAAKNFTLNDTSIQVARAITQPTNIIIFYNAQTVDSQVRANDTLKQYAGYSDKISVQAINSDSDPAAVFRYNVATNPAVVFESGQRKEVVSSLDEQSYTRALLRLSNPLERRVLIVTGHQEYPTTANQTGTSLQATIQALTDNNYQVAIYNSATGVATPAGGETAGAQTVPQPVTLNPANDILLIAGPRGRFSDDEKNRIGAFLRQGGKAMVAYDVTGNVAADQSTNLNDLLSEFGVSFQRGVVVEARADRRVQQNATFLIPEVVGDSSIIGNLQGQNVFVLQSVGIQRPAESVTGTTFIELLKGSTESYLKTNLESRNVELEQGDIRGPVTVGAIVERKATESVPVTVSATVTNSGTLTSTAQLTTRIALFGSPSTFSDVTLSQSVGNLNFFINTMNYLGESANSVVISQRTADNQPFTVNESQASLVFWSAFLGLPILITLIGIWAWWRRR